MIFRLKTSKKTQETLLDLKSKTNITPNILCRYAICISLRDHTMPKEIKDSSGLELNRQVLTGKYDGIFKALIINHSKKKLTDEEFFPDYIKNHLERGINIIYSEYEFAGNVDKFILNIANLSDGGNEL